MAYNSGLLLSSLILGIISFSHYTPLPLLIIHSHLLIIDSTYSFNSTIPLRRKTPTQSGVRFNVHLVDCHLVMSHMGRPWLWSVFVIVLVFLIVLLTALEGVVFIVLIVLLVRPLLLGVLIDKSSYP